MTTLDGATVARKKLRNAANVTEAVSVTMSGADLEFARMTREAQNSVAQSGANLEQDAGGNPRIGSLTVITGAAAGGTATIVIGAGFKDATAVNFDTTPGTSFSVVDDNRINVTSPAHSAGAVAVTVVTPDGNDSLAAAFTYT